jgi:hypothetical protein
MDGGSFNLFFHERSSSAGGDAWPSQLLMTSPTHAPSPRAGVQPLDLNSQAPPGEEFPHLHDYGAYLQGDGEAQVGRGRGSGLPPSRATRSLEVPNQRAGGAQSAPRARQLNFGASTSAAGGRGGGNGGIFIGGSAIGAGGRGGHGDTMLSWPAHGGGDGGIFIGGSSTWASGHGGHDDAIPSWPAHSGGNGGGGRGSRGGRVSGGGRGSRGRSSNRGGALGRGRGGVVAVQGGVPVLRSHPAATT